MRIRFFLIPILSFPLTASAQAEANTLKRMIFYPGECLEVFIKGTRIPDNCGDAHVLINNRYADGRSGFYVFVGERLVTFSGIAPDVGGRSSPPRAQPVDTVLFTDDPPKEADRSEDFPATGSCKQAPPVLGKKSLVECSAETDQGRFYLKFEYNGEKTKVVGAK
jgi:hypothetical protein